MACGRVLLVEERHHRRFVSCTRHSSNATVSQQVSCVDESVDTSPKPTFPRYTIQINIVRTPTQPIVRSKTTPPLGRTHETWRTRCQPNGQLKRKCPCFIVNNCQRRETPIFQYQLQDIVMLGEPLLAY